MKSDPIPNNEGSSIDIWSIVAPLSASDENIAVTLRNRLEQIRKERYEFLTAENDDQNENESDEEQEVGEEVREEENEEVN